jgi:ketosteroid isomerase-like protein
MSEKVRDSPGPEGNVELTRAAVAAWNAGNMDEIRERYHPEAVLTYPPDWVDAGPYIGRDAVMERLAEVQAVAGGQGYLALSELREAGDRVLAHAAFQLDTRGIDMATEVTWVYTFREGLIVECEFFRSRADGLAALGLSD